ncbi:hypothetical protein AMAG_03181 [Allomyces macrogynus ATCC 38327]|uniref:Arrestin C-terminal-like domain-containing protein n=1 Tax=Allomyces macrogynus (strain ATCC 38327) TaxID=578462 RepID=A0A0L0S4V1_ALLM3|nr:hypothetical protein AMAG_03181 [Allomyces macrogynus ATCC 38327]|eukprot:KNE57470.1 hypothetical protein AMAG_03181 [Allomyces macrogynus ATCC 38327]
MSAPTAFSIVLDQQTFVAGDIVRGVVFLRTTDELTVRGLRIVLKGSARARIPTTETRTAPHHHSAPGGYDSDHNALNSTHTETVTAWHTDKKQLVEIETTLWGNRDKGFFVAGSDLRAGQYTFPFAFQLPPTALPSFQSEFGRIRYKLRATIDRPWKSNFVTQVGVHVTAPWDPVVRHAHECMRSVETSKTVCCWFWSKGTVSAMLRSDQTVYSPGTGPLVAQLNIDNLSPRKCHNMTVTLVRKDTYTAQGNIKTIENTVAKVVLGDTVPKHTRNYGVNVPLAMPTEMVPSITGLAVIKVEYILRAYIGVKSACPLKADLPVLVGQPAEVLTQQAAMTATHAGKGALGDPRFVDYGQDGGAAAGASSSTAPPPLPPRDVPPPPAYDDLVDVRVDPNSAPPMPSKV